MKKISYFRWIFLTLTIIAYFLLGKISDDKKTVFYVIYATSAILFAFSILKYSFSKRKLFVILATFMVTYIYVTAFLVGPYLYENPKSDQEDDVKKLENVYELEFVESKSNDIDLTDIHNDDVRQYFLSEIEGASKVYIESNSTGYTYYYLVNVYKEDDSEPQLFIYKSDYTGTMVMEVSYDLEDVRSNGIIKGEKDNTYYYYVSQCAEFNRDENPCRETIFYSANLETKELKEYGRIENIYVTNAIELSNEIIILDEENRKIINITTGKTTDIDIDIDSFTIGEDIQITTFHNERTDERKLYLMAEASYKYNGSPGENLDLFIEYDNNLDQVEIYFYKTYGTRIRYFRRDYFFTVNGSGEIWLSGGLSRFIFKEYSNKLYINTTTDEVLIDSKDKSITSMFRSVETISNRTWLKMERSILFGMTIMLIAIKIITMYENPKHQEYLKNKRDEL